MLLNEKLNDTDQKMLRWEAVHMRKYFRNCMAKTSSTKSPFEIFYGENSKIICLFLEFGRISYFRDR